jgi:hypothetical protein
LLGEPRQQRAARRIGERSKGAVERGALKVNHVVKCSAIFATVKRIFARHSTARANAVTLSASYGHNGVIRKRDLHRCGRSLSTRALTAGTVVVTLGNEAGKSTQGS